MVSLVDGRGWGQHKSVAEVLNMACVKGIGWKTTYNNEFCLPEEEQTGERRKTMAPASSGGIYLNLQRLSGLQHLHLARLQVSVNRIDAWLTSIFTTINQQAVVATSRG